MIKVFIDNYKDIADWFLEKILQKVFGKKKEVIAKLKSYNVNNSNHKILIKLLVNSFACLSKEDVGNFLTYH